MKRSEPDPQGRRSNLAASFAEISRALYSAHTVEETLHRIVAFSVDTIEGCSGAGISFVQGDEVVTPALRSRENSQSRTSKAEAARGIEPRYGDLQD